MAEKETGSIVTAYELEISEIKEILDNLQQRRTTEFHPNASMYGSIETNVKNLRKKLSELIFKIDNDLPSSRDDMDEIF